MPSVNSKILDVLREERLDGRQLSVYTLQSSDLSEVRRFGVLFLQLRICALIMMG